MKCGLQHYYSKVFGNRIETYNTWSVVFSAKYLDIVDQACQINTANKMTVKMMLTLGCIIMH